MNRAHRLAFAYIFDRVGTVADTATPGSTDTASGNYDLAGVLLTDGNASAQGAEYRYDIVSALGGESGTAAATSTSWMTDLLSLF